MKEWLSGNEPGQNGTGDFKNPAILAYKEDGIIKGVLCTGVYNFASEKGPILWVREIAVKGEYQNKGIGKALIENAFIYVRAHGAKRSFLSADECNLAGIHLYEKMGYQCKEDEVDIDMIR